MTINNAEAYLQGVWDWGILQGCFGETKIEPTDIDGCVERNGQFLVLEAKAPTANVTHGQQITFDRMLSTGRFTVVIVWGETNKPERIKLRTKGLERDYDPANLETLRSIVAWWFRTAEKRGH